jgi:hypothetical protein
VGYVNVAGCLFGMAQLCSQRVNTPPVWAIDNMTEISLDSAKDVQFLKSNISLAARGKLDIHLPPSAVPNIHSDTLRKRVEEMLDEVSP